MVTLFCMCEKKTLLCLDIKPLFYFFAQGKNEVKVMVKEFSEYIKEVNQKYQAGNATEHSYRPALQILLEGLLASEKSLQVVNEPKRIECGAPDYIITRGNNPVFYIEAKDIGTDLNSKHYKAQFQRYISSLDTLIITDYLTFQFYQKQEQVETIRIAEIKNDKITAVPKNIDKFTNYITAFANSEPQMITSSKKLADIMASKAKLMAEVTEKILADSSQDGSLHIDFKSFQKHLIRDLTEKEFADLYAQTITYGMFSARLQAPLARGFDRKVAAEQIPKSNPFLRKLFQNIAGYDLDDRLCWIVDDLAQTFSVSDMSIVMKDDKHDPIIHFYEDFLSAYNPELRKSKGVYYTPHEVVNFIVRATDEVLVKDFNLKQGLADTSTFKRDGKDIHKVQILDPATGTGTFLAEAINLIHSKFSNQKGIWQSYVSQHLIPRINGFEVMMAPYTMAHLKLDWLLVKTGYQNSGNQRLKIFLTNALDDYQKGIEEIFNQLLAPEVKGAEAIKKDTPVMVVIGNPPYNLNSQNNNEWLDAKMKEYQYIDGVHFGERKHCLYDDYVKFIRLGQEFVNNNSEGILAFITNHGFIDNLTFRGMRWNLLKTFDKIYIIDLHGNSLKKETAPDGSKDENVFDIQQGVSINIFVKKNVGTAGLADVYHYDIYGKRQDKYRYLQENTLSTIPFIKVDYTAPFYFFLPKLNDNREQYEQGFSLGELFLVYSSGTKSGNDGIAVSFNKSEQETKIVDLANKQESDWRIKYNCLKDGSCWKYASAKNDVCPINSLNYKKICYRPLDIRWTYYTHKSEGINQRPRFTTMRHFVNNKNLGLVFKRQQPENRGLYVFCSEYIIADGCIGVDNKGRESIAPLFIYPTEEEKQMALEVQPNLKKQIVDQIAEKICLQFDWDLVTFTNSSANYDAFSSIDIFDYIYGVMHDPSYCEKYTEFLKIDFAHIPYPNSTDEFWHYVRLGNRLRKLHLMEGIEPDDGIANFDISGTMQVEKIKYEPTPTTLRLVADYSKTTSNTTIDFGRVYINDTQYFDNVPQVAWDFYIGGYLPAQKWLKDRKGRTLTFDDVIYYQKIIKVLKETDNIMNVLR